MRRGSDDVAISDIAGTLLMVGAVVLAGGALTAVVASNLSQPTPPVASIALSPVEAGDATASLLLRHGQTLALGEIALFLQRGTGDPAEVPRASWTTPDPEVWRPGDAISFALAPTVAAGETIRVRVVSLAANALLADASAEAADPNAIALEAPTLAATISPSSILADSTSAATLAVRVSHPAGGLTIASVVADLRNVSLAAGDAPQTLTLRDTGVEGDALGGDGVWSGLVRAKINATLGTYNITINATDLAGRQSASTYALLTISSNLSSTIANFTAFNGTCTNCSSGQRASVGISFDVPSSQNITRLRLNNWVWDTRHSTEIEGDQLLLGITNSQGDFWICRLAFEMTAGQNGAPALARMTVWSKNAETVYVPRNGSLPLASLDLDLLNPVGSLQLAYSTGTADPGALYAQSNVRGTARLSILDISDSRGEAADQGLFAVDVVKA